MRSVGLTGETDIERLVRAVTEQVMRRLGGAAPGGADTTGRPRNALLLLPSPSPRLRALIALAGTLGRDGWTVRIVAGDAAAADAERLGPLATPVERIASAGASGPLADAEPGDVVVLGAVGFGVAGRLARLEDDDPFVRIVVAARLAGRPVLVLDDDLRAAPGTDGEIPRRAEALRRDLERLGLEVVPAADLPARLSRGAAARGTAARSAGGLVTEADVERLHAAGERRLVLQRHTVVTPLARSRAAALGLDLVEKGAD
jgi:hypothetical protein